jgi:hypothetical protein
MGPAPVNDIVKDAAGVLRMCVRIIGAGAVVKYATDNQLE